MRDDDTTWIGERYGYGRQAPVPFGIRRADRRGHLYAIGKTGTGKTTLLENLILQDIANGEGVGLLDPLGGACEHLLDRIPARRAADLCYFNPADLSHPLGFNILAPQPLDRRHLAVASAISAFKSFWGESWGPRLEYVLANALAALMERPRSTLLLLPRLLTDEGYRARIADRLIDPRVRQFWAAEFAGYDKRYRAEATAPVLNKVGQLLMSPMMRNIFGQETNAFDLSFTMDRQRIFLANLSKGKLGEHNANLIGSLLLSNFELAALARADTPEINRPDFYLYADEFHNFTTESFAHTLAESRQYRLCLSLFHQFENQLDDHIRSAIFGDVGTLIAFRVGHEDAEHLTKEFGGVISAAELASLERFEVAVRLLARGTEQVPFYARTLPPLTKAHTLRSQLIEQSRRRFARAREPIERHVAAMLGL